MKKLLPTLFALLVMTLANAQQAKKKETIRTKTEATATITAADKAKVREDIKKRREQNRVELENARKEVKQRITADTLRKNNPKVEK